MPYAIGPAETREMVLLKAIKRGARAVEKRMTED